MAVLSQLFTVKFLLYLSNGKVLTIDNTPEDEPKVIRLSYHCQEHYNCLVDVDIQAEDLIGHESPPPPPLLIVEPQQ
jgi:hypothetical protein